MGWRFHGRASPNSSNPTAQGVCDRCNFYYQLSELRWQYQWRGAGLVNTMFRVCPRCMDVPSAFLKALSLPADPVPVPFPRPSQAEQQMNSGSPALNWDQLNSAWDDGISVWDPT